MLYAVLNKVSEAVLDSPTHEELKLHRELPSIKHVEWHTGEKIHQWNVIHYVAILVQVDGDELYYIEGNFPNLPRSRNGAVCKWRGDFAAFIFDHLPGCEVK